MAEPRRKTSRVAGQWRGRAGGCVGAGSPLGDRAEAVIERRTNRLLSVNVAPGLDRTIPELSAMEGAPWRPMSCMWWSLGTLSVGDAVEGIQGLESPDRSGQRQQRQSRAGVAVTPVGTRWAAGPFDDRAGRIPLPASKFVGESTKLIWGSIHWP